jgi:AhpD family alkylhydroperoxidase
MYNVISAILFQVVPAATLGTSQPTSFFGCAGGKMSEHYHDLGDLRFLKEMGKLAPTEFNAWLNLDKIVGRDEGAIPRKYRELIALGVALTTQCPYCIEVHVKAAKAAGASREEIAESSFIAAALRAGGAATHGAMALKFYDQA